MHCKYSPCILLEIPFVNIEYGIGLYYKIVAKIKERLVKDIHIYQMCCFCIH